MTYPLHRSLGVAAALLITTGFATPASACNCGAAKAAAKNAAASLAAQLSSPHVAAHPSAHSAAHTPAHEPQRTKEAPPSKEIALEAYSGASDGETWVQ